MYKKFLFVKACIVSLLIIFTLSISAVPSVDELTLEEKVGQLFIVHFNGMEVNEDAKRLIEQVHVGGFIYYNWANHLESPLQVRQLSLGLQQLASSKRMPIPLFIAVDQEGGQVSRLVKGFTSFPHNAAVAKTKKPELAEKCALAIGRELRSVGINVNFAPVVDVNSNPENHLIGDRSFGFTANEVGFFGRAALEGYRKASIIACLKHYPGHGDTSIDSHESLPIVNKTIDELASTELMPFQLLSDHTPMIMTAHIKLMKMDPRNCATLSSILLQKVLRVAMCYKGIIISDSLMMEGLLENCSGKFENAAIRAFKAGCDLLLFGGKQLLSSQEGYELCIEDIIALHRSFVSKVKRGEISEEAVNASVQRIIDLKYSHAAFDCLFPDEAEIVRWVGCPSHEALVKEVFNEL